LTNGAEKSATELADRMWEGVLELEPILGTMVGDERYDDRLPDPSEAGLDRRKRFYEGALSDLASIDRPALDLDLRTTMDVLETGAKRELDFIAHRIDRLYGVTHLFGPGNLLADLASTQRADTPERLEKYLGRLSAIPAYLEATGQVAEEAAQIGQTVPRLVVDRTVAQVERLLALSPEGSPGMAPVSESSDADKNAVAAIMKETVWPAYQGYLEMLRHYQPFARDTIGLSALPNGDEMYASQILSFTTLPLEAEKVHGLGKEELAKIQEERRKIAEGLGYQDVETCLAEYKASGKDIAESREALVRLVEEQVARSWEAAPKFFGRLPTDNCQVKPVEEFREKDMPGAFYNPPTADGSRPGVYYVNTGDLQERLLHQTATTTFHEANPGHHFQLSIEIQFTDRVPLRRFGAYLVGDAFVEGWGLYSERLGDEMGLFLDEYERLGMLEAQGFRAGRLIVDTGLHALGWDRERAVRQMEETGAARADSEIEVDRYIAMPGQALAYMIGQLEIQKWRKAAAERESSKFSVKDFHDRVLSLGSLPLSALERELSNESG
jgi:uncharacterized protein (DUF885 family)